MKLVKDLLRAALGMVIKTKCKRCGKQARNHLWDGVERAYFCQGCIR